MSDSENKKGCKLCEAGTYQDEKEEAKCKGILIIF